MSDSPEGAPAKADTRTDREKIEAGEWGECWICREVFRRRTETLRYCKKCGRGWCEGWHGNFSRGFGLCIICGRKSSD
jgi:hypothetical protein